MGVLRSAAHRRAEFRFWGVFIIAVHRAFGGAGCWGWGPGIAVLWSYQRVVRCVTVFACVRFFFFFCTEEEKR